jgi:hypothetical protein
LLPLRCFIFGRSVICLSVQITLLTFSFTFSSIFRRSVIAPSALHHFWTVRDCSLCNLFHVDESASLLSLFPLLSLSFLGESATCLSVFPSLSVPLFPSLSVPLFPSLSLSFPAFFPFGLVRNYSLCNPLCSLSVPFSLFPLLFCPVFPPD